MPQIVTPGFGVIDYPDDAVIYFRAGLPAFESATRFLAVERADTAPLIFLQSLDHASLCFLALPALLIEPAYRLSLAVEDLESLGLPRDCRPEIGKDLICLSILTIPETGPTTANLMAPILIRRDTRIGLQAVQLEGGYDYRHPLFGGKEAPSC